jgi:small-conductance mechanosensitive channel
VIDAIPAILAQAATDPATRPAPARARGEGQSFLERLDLGRTFTETTWTGWGMLLLSLFAGVVIGKLAHAALRSFGERLLARGWTTRGTVFLNAAGPVHLGLITLGLGVGLAWIVLPDPLIVFSARVLALLYIVAAAWFIWNLVDLVEIGLRRLVSRTDSHLDDMLVPLVRKTLRLFLVVLFVLFTAENIFGADITAWLAGLGIAGLAVSLAAQDSIKNFFGSITILLDRPFVVGDRIVFDGHDGPVEEIGFRSTKMRTMAGELVTIPNSKFTDGSVLNISKRPNLRRMMNIGLPYDTPPDKVEQAVQIVRGILAEPEIASAFDLEKLPPRVYFNEYKSDNLNIWVIYWFYPPDDWWAFMEHTQRVNLKLLRGFEQARIEFAFPTQTIYLAGDQKRELALRIQRDGVSSSAADTRAGAGAGDGSSAGR